MIKLETHCHTSGVSSCGDTKTEEIIRKYLDAGYGGIIVTNHFSRIDYEKILIGDNRKQKIDYFFKVYDDFANECAKNGLKTFFAAEIRVRDARAEIGTEYIVLGLPRSEYYSEKPLYDLEQKTLFELAEKHGAFMYQTHPFRTGAHVGNPEFMHGVESFNGHYHHQNNNALAEEFRAKNGLIGLAGTDFHHPDQPVTSGVLIDENISLEKELIKRFFDRKFQMIF